MRKPRKYCNYSDREKAEALLALEANGGNLAKTAKDLNIPYSTLTCWQRETRGINPDVLKMRDEKREPLADMFERVARVYLEHAETDVIVAKTPGQSAVIAAATATDKAQLLRGKATVIVDNLASRRGAVLGILNAKLERGISEAEAFEQLRMAEIDPEDIAWVAGLTPEQRQAQIQELGKVG